MPIEQTFQITQNLKLFNTDYPIRQFMIQNNTSKIIYINLSGFPPNKVQYDYLVQPNSTFVSPKVATRALYTLIEDLNNQKTVPTLTLFDSERRQASNVGLQLNQPVKLDQFPALLEFTTPNAVALPSFVIDRFNTIYVIITCSLSYMGIILRVAGNGKEYGYLSAGGGVITIVPDTIPAIYNLEIFVDSAYPASTGIIEVNVVQSSDVVLVTNPVTNQLRSIPPNDGISNNILIYRHGVNPPGFIHGLFASDVFGAGYTPNFNYTMNYRLSQFPFRINSFLYNIGVLPPYPPVLNNTVFLVNNFTMVEITIENLDTVNDVFINLDIAQL